MSIQQIAVFLENRRGRVKELTEALARKGIDLLTLSIADTNDFGILRLITRDNKNAVETLKEAGFTATLVDLIGIEVPDEVGGLNKVLELLYTEEINIEYLYSFAHTSDQNAIILLRASDDEKALAALRKHNVKIIDKLKY